MITHSFFPFDTEKNHSIKNKQIIRVPKVFSSESRKMYDNIQ